MLKRSCPRAGWQSSMIFKGLLQRVQTGGPDRAWLAAVNWREFDAASFTWCGPGQKLPITVQFCSLRFEGGISTASLEVLDHGLEIACTLDGSETHATLYLGNSFIVPPGPRRRGLASAVLLACTRSFQHASFGRVLAVQQIRLQGYFVGDGARFALAVCNGVQPNEGKPSAHGHGAVGALGRAPGDGPTAGSAKLIG